MQAEGGNGGGAGIRQAGRPPSELAAARTRKYGQQGQDVQRQGSRAHTHHQQQAARLRNHLSPTRQECASSNSPPRVRNAPLPTLPHASGRRHFQLSPTRQECASSNFKANAVT